MSETLSNLSREDRHFDPSPEFAADANVKAPVYEKAATDRLAFWAAQAERLDWAKPWTACSSGSVLTRSGSWAVS